MANTTFKGPVRSQNGFQEWDGSAWVPVGGGGGGTTVIELSQNNWYSDNYDDLTPSSGNIIQLPEIGIGETYTIVPYFAGTLAVWALQLPVFSGTLAPSFYGVFRATNSYLTGTYEPTVYAANFTGSGPEDIFYIYGALQSPLQLVRQPNIDIPGFGILGFVGQLGTCAQYVPPLPSPYQFPYSQLISP